MSSPNLFQSTLPLRGATVRQGRGADRVGISIHTPLAGSDVVDVRHVYPVLISIHTPLAGSDFSRRSYNSNSFYFNPHSPCGERLLRMMFSNWLLVFQSTLPLRGATMHAQGHGDHGPRISIHTPLAGSDAATCSWRTASTYFNPHSPCGERPIGLLESTYNK